MDWIGTIQWLATIAQGIGTVVALLAVYSSNSEFRKQFRAETYSKLDAMYFNLQQLAMNDPRVAHPHRQTAEPGFSERYDVYAFMVWNFIETIYDLCDKKDDLPKTWALIVEREARLHRDWFCAASNFSSFKPEFRDWLNCGGYHKENSPMHGQFALTCPQHERARAA